MARALKGKTPDTTKITKPKILVFGPPGVRKTWESIAFPKSYYIDTEGGASLPAYQLRLRESGGMYFGKEEGSQDFQAVINEIITLATTKHPFLTLVIDSFSKLYNLAAAEAEREVGNDFGKDKKEAQKPTRQLMSWLERLDMNVLLICHEKEKWKRQGGQLVTEGQTFDGWDKMEYDLHLAIRVSKIGAHVTKSRLEGFPLDLRFPWSFQEVEKRCGDGIMLRPPRTVELATRDELKEITRLLGAVKVPDKWEKNVLEKAGVSEWNEMDRDKVQACIKHLAGLVTNGEEQ